jgi:hypothetical protein
MPAKGIFCIEGLWENDLKQKSTVQPILDLLHLNEKIPYICRDSATIEELEFYLKKWTQKAYKKYPILYLAFHGEENEIVPGRRNYSMDDLRDLVKGQCKNKILIFASCSTVSIDKRKLKTFLKVTDALAVCGYKNDVDWMKSTAFELLLLSTLQENHFDGRGIDAIQRKTVEISRMFKNLEYRIVTSKD